MIQLAKKTIPIGKKAIPAGRNLVLAEDLHRLIPGIYRIQEVVSELDFSLRLLMGELAQIGMTQSQKDEFCEEAAEIQDPEEFRKYCVNAGKK